MKSTVSEKGQVTIPKPLRDSLALVPGTEIEFEEQDGVLVARRVVSADPLSHLIGLLPRTDVDAALTNLRGPGWNSALDEGIRGHRRR
ncbi:MAG: AbrB/MazE/SpoVT family DNA-binding domain-containing protein [Acidobacteriota bacterium]